MADPLMVEDETEPAPMRTPGRAGSITHWTALGASILLLACIFVVAWTAPTLLTTTVQIALAAAVLGLLVQGVGIALSFRPAPVPTGSLLSRFRRGAGSDDGTEDVLADAQPAPTEVQTREEAGA